MADLQDYIDVAPTVMDGAPFTVTQIENKLESIPDPPPPPTPPTITNQKKIQIFNLVFQYHSASVGIEAAGGINEIAKTVELWPSQVLTLITEMTLMKAVYDNE